MNFGTTDDGVVTFEITDGCVVSFETTDGTWIVKSGASENWDVTFEISDKSCATWVVTFGLSDVCVKSFLEVIVLSREYWGKGSDVSCLVIFDFSIDFTNGNIGGPSLLIGL